MNTLDTLREILVKEFALDGARVTADADLVQLGIDSLNLIDFVFKIEDRFELQIKDDLPTNLVTLRDVAQYIDRLVAEKSVPPVPASAAPTTPVE